MKNFDETSKAASAVLFRICEILALLVALFVLIYLLLGETSGGYVISVVANLSLLVSAVTPQSLIGIGIIFGLYLIWKNRR